MPAKRGGGAPLLGKSSPKSDTYVERFVPSRGKKIGTVPVPTIKEAGATRVKRSNTKLKREIKAWRVKSPFRRWRLSNNLTIQEAADTLGVANMTYQQWEYGRYNIPQIVMVNKQRHRFNEMLAPICGFTRAIHNSWMKGKPKTQIQAKTIRGADDE